MTAARRLRPRRVFGHSRLMGEDEAVKARRFANIARNKMFLTRSL